MRNHVRILVDSGAEAAAPAKKRSRAEVSLRAVTLGENGAGTPRDPFQLPLREPANRSGCRHCPDDKCECKWFAETLDDCYENQLSCKREVLRSHRSDLCAKSVLPPFVARLVRHSALKHGEVFYDFGCGNGSVLFQVAYLTGNSCVGIEINPINAKVAREAWRVLKPVLEKRSGRKLDVEIVCADFCHLLKDEHFFSGSCVVWAANLLLPKPVNHYLSERLRAIPVGSRIFCFEDLYPHSRSVASLRDADAFARFAMHDFLWQPESVEWCDIEGPFYQYTRKGAPV